MNDADFLRQTIELAKSAREKGNHPFGSLLADGAGRVLLTAENTVVTEADITGHAELNLVREAARRFTRDELACMTLYASREPCPMPTARCPPCSNTSIARASSTRSSSS